MRKSLLALVALGMTQCAAAFEFIGVQSGQSEAEVTETLAANGVSANKIDDGLYVLEEHELKGWAVFCKGALHTIGMSYPYKNFPALLQEAMDNYGNGDLLVYRYGFWKKSDQIVYEWKSGEARYVLSLGTSKEFPVGIVVASWSLQEDCKPSGGG